MAKLYVFGIGGTGSRVIKSLTMLMASGIDTKFDVVPIIIDPDSAGGDLNKSIKILRDYQNIEQALRGHDDNHFFKNKLTTLADVVTKKGSGAKTFNGFRFELEGVQNDRFKDFLDFNALDAHNKYLTQLLFSEKNLDADLDVGFKGNPNIGSVVLNQFTKSEVFETFADSFQPDDRIFIISSIFGGTGAAGFPLLVKNIRNGVINGKNYEHVKNAKIGAITVLPYFKVDQNEDSEIDSHGFITKTKAALHYYSRNISGNNSVNALYYIGDAAENRYKNVEGGTHQKNDAHFIELASALSIVDYTTLTNEKLESSNGKALNPSYKEYGVNGDKDLCFNDLHHQSKHTLTGNLSRYFYFHLFLKDQLKWAIEKAYPFTEDGTNKFDESFLHQSFYKTLSDFNKEYGIWLAEMQRNQISFSPFAIAPTTNEQNEITGYKVATDSIFTLVKGIPEKKNKFNPFEKNDYNLYVNELNDVSHKLGNAPDTPKRFMSVFSGATKSLINKKLL